MNTPARTALVKLLSSALLDQAVLSACSFAVSIILIRHSADHQYGYYVLATNAVLLLVTLQNAFFGAPLVNSLTRTAESEHGVLVTGLLGDQRRYLRWAAGALLAASLLAWIGGLTHGQTAMVLAAFAVLAMTMLNREFFRIVLIARRRTHTVLRADLCFVAILLPGVWIAAHSTAPAVWALLTMCVAAVASGGVLAWAARRGGLLIGARNAEQGALRRLAPLGAWAAAGGAIHWTFSQGYSYLVAGTLDLEAVAAISAVRLLMMPLNLLSTGLYQLMLPTASRWLHTHGPAVVFRRLLLIAGVFLLLASVYCGIVWLARGWLFGSVMQKDFANRDVLLSLWGGIFSLMVARDQLIFLPVLAERFRQLAGLALGCALLTLAVSYSAMQVYGAPGALAGMLAGEAANLLGVLMLALHETRIRRPAATVLVGGTA